MNGRQSWAIVAVVVAVGMVAWFFASKLHAQQRTTDPWQRGGPHRAIDDAARSASGTDESLVRNLTEAVFGAYPHAFGQIPTPFDAPIKDRLTRAESAYRRGTGSGVMEEDVVNLANTWADHLRLPDYARTNARQVRVLRMSLMMSSPVFMSQGATSPDMKVGDSIKPVMSPLQAVHLLMTLMDQKLINPEYQVTPDEWDASFQQSNLERLKRFQEAQKAGTGMKTARLTSVHNPKHRELREAVSQGLSSLSPTEAFDMVDAAFRTLKIGQ